MNCGYSLLIQLWRGIQKAEVCVLVKGVQYVKKSVFFILAYI
jgi:hypothetical protein